jgi:hypothetical protein
MSLLKGNRPDIGHLFCYANLKKSIIGSFMFSLVYSVLGDNRNLPPTYFLEEDQAQIIRSLLRREVNALEL